MNQKEYLEFCKNVLNVDKGIAVMGFNSMPSYPLAEDVGTINSSSHYFQPKSGEKILDIGCGYGRFLFECLSKDMICFGIDPSKEMINIGIDLNEHIKHKIKFKVGDYTNIQFENNFFDHIWCYGVTEYLSLFQINKMLKKIFKWIKPDGKVYLEFKNRLHVFSLLSEMLRIFSPKQYEGYRYSYTIPTVYNISKKNFFNVENLFSESSIIFPLYYPKNSGDIRDVVIKGMPENLYVRFIPIFPKRINDLFKIFFKKLKKLSKHGFSFPAYISKEYMIILKKRKA